MLLIGILIWPLKNIYCFVGPSILRNHLRDHTSQFLGSCFKEYNVAHSYFSLFLSLTANVSIFNNVY